MSLYLKRDSNHVYVYRFLALFLISLPFPGPTFLVSRLVSCVSSRVPGPTNCTISSAPPAPAPGPATNPEPSAHIWAAAAGDLSRLSSDEGDAETAEDGDRPAFHFSNHHPQPLGVSFITISISFMVHFNFKAAVSFIKASLPRFSVACSAAGSWVGATMSLIGDGTG